VLESSSVPLSHSFPPSPSVHVHLPCPCPPSLSAALGGCVCQVDRSDISQLEAVATRLHTYDDFRTQVRRQGGGGDGTPHVAHWCPVPLLVARDCCEGCRSSCPALWLVVTIRSLPRAPSHVPSFTTPLTASICVYVCTDQRCPASTGRRAPRHARPGRRTHDGDTGRWGDTPYIGLYLSSSSRYRSPTAIQI
jgi:hypothetical protein